MNHAEFKKVLTYCDSLPKPRVHYECNSDAPTYVSIHTGDLLKTYRDTYIHHDGVEDYISAKIEDDPDYDGRYVAILHFIPKCFKKETIGICISIFIDPIYADTCMMQIESHHIANDRYCSIQELDVEISNIYNQ
jgi:hypothetical protein